MSRTRNRVPLGLPSSLLLLALGCATHAKSPFNAQVSSCLNAYFTAYRSGTALRNDADCNWSEISDLALADAIQTGIVKQLGKEGEIVGYKVTFSDDGRVIGRLSDAMLLQNGATIDLSTGARILVEGDLLVRIASGDINTATTVEEVAAQIDQLIPFMESSNMMLPRGTPRRKAIWTATNGNTRWGVVGEPITPWDASPHDIAKKFQEIEVSLFDAGGNELQRLQMNRHPLLSVLDVIEELQRTGGELKAGDLVSLGNFGRPRFPNPGDDFSALYHGLREEPVKVEVRFR